MGIIWWGNVRRKKVKKVGNKKKTAKQVKGLPHNFPIIPNNSFEDYSDYCKSKYFIALKSAVLNKYGGLCQKCNKKANTAHHLKYRNQWTDSRVQDCIAVCNPCHEKIHRFSIKI